MTSMAQPIGRYRLLGIHSRCYQLVMISATEHSSEHERSLYVLLLLLLIKLLLIIINNIQHLIKHNRI